MSVTKSKAATRAESSEKPSTPRRVRCKLDSIDDVKAELARLYRSARAGDTAMADASRLGNLLAILARLIEGADLERRLEALEKHNAKEKQTWSSKRH